jgi:hypothetical protein
VAPMRWIATACAALLACGDGGGGSTGPGNDARPLDGGGTRIDGGGGVSRCGNDVCEGVETADNCCEDCGCGDGESCTATGCACIARYDVAYSTDLAAEQAGCDGVDLSFGPDCNAAINRWCSGRGCATTGFGPVEHSGDDATVVCLGATVVATSFAALGAFDPGCTTDSAYSLECNHAIHLLCAAEGADSGFGLLENGADIAVGCAPDADLVDTTYAALSGFHPGCDGTAPGLGDSCNAAINRLCQDRGAISGFGPVTIDGSAVSVACVR